MCVLVPPTLLYHHHHNLLLSIIRQHLFLPVIYSKSNLFSATHLATLRLLLLLPRLDETINWLGRLLLLPLLPLVRLWSLAKEKVFFGAPRETESTLEKEHRVVDKQVTRVHRGDGGDLEEISEISRC